MDSNNNVNVKEENELDIRDIANYLLGKLWIIILAMVCFAVVAIIFTSTITPKYTSRATMFITNTQDSSSSSQTMSDWNVGKQLAITSPELIDERFCARVFDDLISARNVAGEAGDKSRAFISFFIPAGVEIPFEENEAEYKAFILNYGKRLLPYISVTSDDDTCIVTFTVTTTNAQMSALIATSAADKFGDYINDFMASDSIRTVTAKEGAVSSAPSNVNYGRNTILAAVVGAVLAAVVLIVVFMFDDKIKTPDDIDRYLGLSVLGVIPEIDVEA